MDATFKKRTVWVASLAIVGMIFWVVAPTGAENKKPYTLDVPKPDSHKVDWISKHQIYGKQDPTECQQCHTNQMFCANCHERRDTVQQQVHRRNFRFFHSIQARANPRRCDACHTVEYCQDCHSGRGTSKR